ncbi:MAG: tRNA uridine-5-carboxymethylaminomethyl(34) synthesis GTPase MnmE [Thiotrichales bacterium]|nr:tRNA uridine-5-carboxymethylaminomethyl(34) synthesis GTPase MnmE [Thiotrichales bacterium]
MNKGGTGNDTIVAIATPPGKGAIGVVRVSGPEASRIAQALTGKLPQPKQFLYSAFVNAQGETIDDGIVLYFKGPQSYTGDDMIEFQGHGSPPVLQELVNTIMQQGARQARPGEFTERAYLNNKLDLLQAEAVADLIESRSLRAAKNARQSLQGRFSADVDAVVSALTDVRAHVECSLDFPDEELPLDKDTVLLNKLRECQGLAADLLRRSERGRKLSEGQRVVIAGRPNVGKSSLLNQLAGHDAAIVSEASGTTRDVIEQELSVSGLPLTLVDTAGLRRTDDPVETEGVTRARRAIENADLVINVNEYDPQSSAPDELSELSPSTTGIAVYNKIDLHGHVAGFTLPGEQAICLSAKTGAGVELLLEAIKQAILQQDSGEDLLLARARHINAMKKAQECLTRGYDQLQAAGAGELLAEELRMAQEALAEIKGEFLPDDLLAEIFSRFCIGK